MTPLNFSRVVRLTLADGETVDGRVNYTTATHVEIITTADAFRWIERAQIRSVEGAK